MAAFKKPGRTIRDRKPQAKKAAAEARAEAAALKAASGNTSTKRIKRVKPLRALGLRRIGHTNTLPDRPEIRGMLQRVPHLIEIKEGK